MKSSTASLGRADPGLQSGASPGPRLTPAPFRLCQPALPHYPSPPAADEWLVAISGCLS